MKSKNNEPIDNEFEDLKDKLQDLNQVIENHSSLPLKTQLTTETQDLQPHQTPPAKMRDKLRTINEYLRRYLSQEAAKVPEEYTERVMEAPTTIGQVERRAEAFPEEILKEIEEQSQAERFEETKTPCEETITLGISLADGGSEKMLSERIGVGLDLGTAYLVAAREASDKRVFVKNERNTFLPVRADKATQDLLTKLKVKYALLDGEMFVLGNLALNFASIFNRETQRPMRVGILNPSEIQSIPIIKLLIQNILWPPRKEKEVCCFSIPANPIDTDQDTIYHKDVFERILRLLGFEPVTIDEGYAVVLAELAYKDFTGIGISCGGGMVNVCAAYKSVPLISFSITRGGDWIDKSAASVLDIQASNVTTIKEQGVDLSNPSTREEEAIAIYYRNFTHYFLEIISKVFGKNTNIPQFMEPVDIVFAGGSTMANGFLNLIEEEMQSIDLGLNVGNIKISDDPFTSVSRGCLFHAINTQMSTDEHK